MAELPSNQAIKKIEHVVVLMLENRSFDSLLGRLYKSGSCFDGLTVDMANRDSEGELIKVRRATSLTTRPDPLHDFASVTDQLIGPNQGFVVNYEKTLTPDEWSSRRQVMEYQTGKTLKLLYRLAKEYAVSDRWFSSVPAQTWPNRLFVHCGTSAGQVSNRLPQWMPPRLYQLESIFSRFGRGKDAWACYNDQIPCMIVIQELADEFRRSRHEKDSHFRSLKQFECDCKNGTLPRYSFIEPSYLFKAADSDHPPHSLAAGQRLIHRIYKAVRKSVLWPNTVLLILYDEHGGLFDHAIPPQAPAPEVFRRGKNESNFRFARLGLRVPCILISAWTTKGMVFRPPTEKGFFDHTSVIRTLQERWPDLGAPLTHRDRAASSFWHALDLQEARVVDELADQEIDALATELGPPLEDSPPFTLFRRPGLAAVQVALTAPLAAVPGLRRLPALRDATAMNRDLAILGALVATLGRADRSKFDPAGPPESVA